MMTNFDDYYDDDHHYYCCYSRRRQLRGRFLPPFICLSVLPHDISKTDAARISKLHIEMFHDESRKQFILSVKKSNEISSFLQATKNCRRGSLHPCGFVSAGFF